MGLFKGKKDDEDGNRSALFGSRSKNNKSPNPATQNPYANVPTPADAYNAAKAKAGVPGYAQHGPPGGPAGGDRYGGGAAPPGRGGYGGPPPGQNRYGGPPPAEKERYGASPAPQGRSGYPDDKKGGSGGYGADKYGAQGGYGADRYGPSGRVGGAEGPNPPAKHGAGGYGGLGGAPAPAGDADDGRAALFGGARDRVQRRTDQQMGYGGGPPPAYEEGGNDEFNTGRDPNEPQYEAYGDRQLTAEEEEEEDVTATKQQIRFIKQEDVSSTRNALRIAAQAEETGMNTLARIGAQGERIHNTEKNLDLTSNHNRMAEDKARELKTLNRSMFAVHVSNPFTAGSRAEKRDNDVLDRHHLEREQREATRRQGYDSNQRMEKTFRDLNGGKAMSAADRKQASLVERAKFQFEADSEDEEMENEIDSNLDALGGAAARLNGLARATGKEVDEQNRHLERINQKSSKVDDESQAGQIQVNETDDPDLLANLEIPT